MFIWAPQFFGTIDEKSLLDSIVLDNFRGGEKKKFANSQRGPKSLKNRPHNKQIMPFSLKIFEIP